MGHTKKNNSGKVTDGEWHRFRATARRTAWSPEEFSGPERTRYNLDADDALSPAGVTGRWHEALGEGEDIGPGDDTGGEEGWP